MALAGRANVIGHRKAPPGSPEERPLRIMLAAHVDEIGFMVRHVDKEDLPFH